jgi:hypothetical protein
LRAARLIGARARGLALAIVMLASYLAQAQNPPPPPPSPDTTPRPLFALNGLLLHPQRLRYDLTVVTADGGHVIGQRDVELRQTSLDAIPSWMVVETRTGTVPSNDTIYLSNLGLQPLRWTSVLGLARLSIDFTADSILGATSGPPGRHAIALPNRADLLVGAPMTELALQILPLSVGRQDSVAMLVVDLGRSEILPATISIDGEEDLVTVLGRVHCWTVTLMAGDLSTRLWVSTENPVVVRTRQSLPGRPGATLQQELTQRR